MQDLIKENTEMRLTFDVQKSTISSLESERAHMKLELTETKELLEIYEERCAE